MKEVLIDLATYHRWANKRLTDVVLKSHQDVSLQIVKSSFPSLFKTFLHLYESEQIWLLRLQMKEKPEAVKGVFDGEFNELAEKFLAHNALLIQWLQEQKEVFYSHPIAYYNSQKHYFKTPVYQCLFQLFNHGTYHRGQVVTMFHELGITKIPATDYIAFKRQKSKLYS